MSIVRLRSPLSIAADLLPVMCAGGLMLDGPGAVIHRPGRFFGVVRDARGKIDPNAGLTFDLGDRHDKILPSMRPAGAHRVRDDDGDAPIAPPDNHPAPVGSGAPARPPPPPLPSQHPPG